MKKIINEDNIDYTKQPIFFGEDLGIQRYDIFKYKKLYELFIQQLSFYWRPEEVNISLDSGQFKELSQYEKDIFTKNLKYQILLDSVQSRGIPSILKHTTNPELEACGKAWEFFETIHSYSYTYIIKNVFPNPSQVFDSITEDKEIMRRAQSVTKYYNQLLDGTEDLKKKLYLTLISINILEGLRFFVSFVCSYAFAEMGKMEGNAKIISLINRDENLHLSITQNIIRILTENKEEGFQETIKECEEIVSEMYEMATNEEMDWARYLFKDGSLLGLNEEILIDYMKWLTNKRMKAIGLKPLFGKVENPINWINNWTNSKDVQVAPQETEIESYKVGSIKHDTSNMDFSGFDL